MKEKLKTLASIAVIIAGTIALLYYSKGYRFSLNENMIIPTGALSISSSEFRSDININGANEGKSPKSITSLQPGKYNVKVTKNDFIDWEREIQIYPEKTIPIYATLFLKPDKSEISPLFKLDSYLIDLATSPDQNFIYFITSSTDNGFQERIKTDAGKEASTSESSNNTPTTIETETLKVIKVWRFNPNANFWDFRENPALIYETQLRDINSLDLKISPDGSKTLLIYTDITEQGAAIRQILNLDGTKFNTTPQNIDFEGLQTEIFTRVAKVENQNSPEISWSENSNVLTLTYTNNLFSFDPLSNELTRVDTDELQGILTSFETDEENNIYVAMYDAKESRTQIYVKPILEGNFQIFASDIKDAVKSFKISRSAAIAVLQTEKKLSVYHINNKELHTISDGDAQFLSFSPDDQKILYRNFGSNILGIYHFDKDEGNPSVDIGDKLEISIKPSFNNTVFWSQEADFITYLEDGDFKTVDLFGYNKSTLYSTSNKFAHPNNSVNRLFTFEGDNGFLTLSQKTLR